MRWISTTPKSSPPPSPHWRCCLFWSLNCWLSASECRMGTYQVLTFLYLGQILKKDINQLEKIGCVLRSLTTLILTLKDSFISESCIEIKTELNFHFHTSLWCLKRFYEGLFLSSSEIGTGRVKTALVKKKIKEKNHNPRDSLF